MLKPRIPTATIATVARLTVAEHQRLTGVAWQRARNRVMTAAGGLCQCADCTRDKATRHAHEVDHIIPVWAGGTDDDANLQAINRDCHAVKTAREAELRARNDLSAARQDALGRGRFVGV
jgi:5-methylcytosine-specific restriction protein A